MWNIGTGVMIIALAQRGDSQGLVRSINLFERNMKIGNHGLGN